jgi:radical SAM protein with 4Fe4S-binding SPASM domain
MREVTIETIPVNRIMHPFPKVVIFEIVAGCNLFCIMCPLPQMTRPAGLMDLELYKRLGRQIAEEDPDTEVWATIMGEVFVHKEAVFDYLQYAKREAGLNKVYLNTNLVLFREEFIDRLEESGLDKMTVGLDGATQATYDKIRVGGDYQQVLKNIDVLLNAKSQGRLQNLEVILQFIVQDENAHEEELFKEKWIGSGATVKIRQKLGWGTGVEANNLAISNDDRTVPCPWLMRTMSIHWTGKVAQCDAEWNGERYVGDLNVHTIKEVWMDQLLGKRQRHLNNDFDFEPCRDCKDWQCGRSEFYR